MASEENIWDRRYKIPWDDPDFSRRMLAEHLSQDHNMASRRIEWIDKQVAWIHDDMLGAKPARILDLGCGPGLYSHRLAALGHNCFGIDFGPASVEYARQHNPAEARCQFVLADIREADFGGPYDLGMILFGELNTFSPAEAAAILGKARAAIAPGGRLIAEIQAAEAVERVGLAEPSESTADSGLFSDGPHRCRTENRWLADERVAVQTFRVTETDTGQTRQYRSTSRAWADADLTDLLTTAGFTPPILQPDWPCNTDDLELRASDA